MPTASPGPDDLFESHRSVLRALAYRMCGTKQDAEDVVQDAWLRWFGREVEPENPRAWLVRVVTNLCLDRLKRAQVQREVYVGPWLPEPVRAEPAASPHDHLELARSLSMAFLVLLQSLSPAERAALLLHDVFGYGYDDLQVLLGREQAACRQLVTRARRAIELRRPRYEPDVARAESALAAFMAACQTGDPEAVMAMLTEDVTAVADGGGVVPGAGTRPVVGRQNVARLILGLITKIGPEASYSVDVLNAQPALVVRLGGVVLDAVCFEWADGRIRTMFSIVNPAKLGGVSVA